MAFSLTSALKRIALVAAFSGLTKPRPDRGTDVTPEPRRRTLYANGDLDEGLFDVNRTEVADQIGMLSSEMDRLSGALNGVRGLLSTIAAAEPVYEEATPSMEFAAMHEDAMLFDGEAEFAGETVRPLGDASFLFDELSEPVAMPGSRIDTDAAVSHAA